MRKTVYEPIDGASDSFTIEYSDGNQIAGLRNPGDIYAMNWTKGNKLWGTVACELDLSVSVLRSFTDQGRLKEVYIFQNETGFDICTMDTVLGIYTPFPDYYTSADVCMKQCCNTHIWCGGNSSYIMALRMGGKGPNLGLAVRDGSIKGYSVERKETFTEKEEELSGRRGDFILHPESMYLRPGETYTLTWELFWFEDKEDFQRKLSEIPDFVSIKAESYLLTGGKNIRFSIGIFSEDTISKPVVTRAGKQIFCDWKDGKGEICEDIEKPGEYNYEIIWKDRRSKTSFLVLPHMEELAEKRCRFIAEYQQCHDEKSCLDGAYLIYDNEEHRQYYGHRNDHNAGRERIGMGVLMAYYFQEHKDEVLERSLDDYVKYVLRELFDPETGEVFNDAPRCRDDIRLYNYPWMSRFFLELYNLKKDEVFLEWYFKSVEYFYHEGGSHFYAIGMPMQESVQIFRKAGREKQAEKLLVYYREQGDFILSCGRNYPAHEVDYEQSIVAPAAIYMCELYRLTGEEKYKTAAKEQLEVLDLFQGFQPDYHMNEVAVRHWDGYWFGKRRCLGDTYPHYWSALSGYAYTDTERIADTDRYARKAKNTLQAVLSLFKEDGSASCAMVYPMSVNGKKAAFYDPWANDQDWGLYFALKLV